MWVAIICADAALRPLAAFLLQDAVLEMAVLVDAEAVGAVLGNADRAGIEAKDGRISRSGLCHLLVRMSIDQS